MLSPRKGASFMSKRTRRAVRIWTLRTAQRGMRVSKRLAGMPRATNQDDREALQIMRTRLPMMILKALAWIAYPCLFVSVRLIRCLGNLCS